MNTDQMVNKLTMHIYNSRGVDTIKCHCTLALTLSFAKSNDVSNTRNLDLRALLGLKRLTTHVKGAFVLYSVKHTRASFSHYLRNDTT